MIKNDKKKFLLKSKDKNIISKIIIKYIILFINIFCILFNIIFLLKKIIKKYNFFEIKNIDQFYFNLFSKTYKEFSIYLNNKFNSKINKNNDSSYIINEVKTKKIIKLYGVNLFNFTYHKLWLQDKIGDKFILKFDKNNPDYLFYNVFGKKNLNPKYKDSVKIAVLTENFIPDLNEADYALAHSHINYLDRYFKYSLLLWQNYENIKEVREKVLNSPLRTKFCASIISNIRFTDNFRLIFIEELNKYKQLDMGGSYQNNIGGRINNKIRFLTSYKFSIAMENTKGDGYVTEKLIDSFLSGTIPIYYGDYMVDEYINPKSYIHIKGEKDMKKKIEYIKSIDNDDEKYKSLIKEDVIIDKKFSKKIDNELKSFLIHIFEQDKSKAYRKDRRKN